MREYGCKTIKEESYGSTKTDIYIRAPSQLNEDQLKEIAFQLRERNDDVQYLNIYFYLPRMHHGKKAWATTHFRPELKIIINEVDKEQKENDILDSKLYNWYEGGTLHQATVGEWKKATEKNKLATCADFMAIADKSSSMKELKSKAMNLMNCIDEATRGLDELNNEKVADIVALCSITLGYH